MFSFFQDVRFGLRMLAKHRLATLVSVVALALGIGANTAMFSLAEAFLLHPVPFENADRTVALVNMRPEQNIDMTPKSKSPARSRKSFSATRCGSSAMHPTRTLSARTLR